MIGVGVIGLGFMGRTHVAAYRDARAAGHPNRLVAVADPRAAARAGEVAAGGNLATGAAEEGLFDPADVAGYATAAELLADEAVELVSVCTPTDTHVELALAALEAGKHVLVEKPVATRVEDVRRLADAARASDRLCMPAMCIRFWPAWRWLRERVVDGSFGAVSSAVFRRLSAPPAWGTGFYEDVERSGGALFDLHVHDADFVRFLFGPPDEVRSTGTSQHVTTLYRYADGPAHVTAEGGWDHDQGFEFRMAYTVVFERATVDHQSGRDPELLVMRDGAREAVDPGEGDGYDHEVRHLLDAIANGTPLDASMDEAVGLTEMLVAERASLER